MAFSNIYKIITLHKTEIHSVKLRIFLQCNTISLHIFFFLEKNLSEATKKGRQSSLPPIGVFEGTIDLVLQSTAFQCRIVDTEGTHLTEFLFHVGDDTHAGILVHLEGRGQQRTVGLAA